MPNQEIAKELDAVLNFSERVGSAKSESNIVKRAVDILFRPGQTWPVIAQEAGGLKEAFIPYGLIICMIPAMVGAVLSNFMAAGLAILGGEISRTTSPIGILFHEVILVLFSVLYTLVIGKIVSWIAPLFGKRNSWVLSVRALVYGSTPIAVASLVSWIPLLGWLVGSVAGLWSLFLTFRGLCALLQVSESVQPEAKVNPVEDHDLAHVN